MPKYLDYDMTKEELAELEQAIRTEKAAAVRQRATALRMLHLGQSPAQVATSMAVKLTTIYAWYHRWREQGLAGLRNRPKSGRPRKADAAYEQRLVEVIASDPEAFGYGFTIWSVERLRQHLAQETGLDLSESRFRALLKKMDYVYRRPKHELSALQDREAYERGQELLEWVKKKPSATTLNSSLWTKRP